MQTEVTRKDLRSFGLIVGGVFSVIGLWPVIRRGGDYRVWALALSALLIGPALVFPALLKPLHTVWMKLGEILAWINTRIILGAIFFAVVTPMGLFRRMIGKDSMGRQRSSDAESYRVLRNARSASHMTRQY